MASQNTLSFGIGALVATPQGGGSPVQFGTLQEVEVDFKSTLKELMGQFKFPVAVAAGAFKITWKAKSANVSASVFNLLFGATPTVGQKLWAYTEADSTGTANSTTFTAAISGTAMTSSAGTPVIGAQITGTGVSPGTFIVSGSGTAWVVNQSQTVSSTTMTMVGEGFKVTNSAAFDQDMGISYASTGAPLTKVSGIAPSAGQYLVSAGVYSFHPSDASKGFVVNYTYTQSTTGYNTVVANSLMGAVTPFQLDLYENNAAVAGQQWSLRLYNAISDGVTLGFKNEDWTVPDISGGAFANAANNVFEFNTAG